MCTNQTESVSVSSLLVIPIVDDAVEDEFDDIDDDDNEFNDCFISIFWFELSFL